MLLLRLLPRLLSLLVLVILGLAVWLGVRAWLAKDHLEQSADLVQRLQTQVQQGDTAAAHHTLLRLQAETQDAVRLTGDPVWRAAQHLPWGGDDLRAVHVVSVAGHTLAVQSLPGVTAAATDVDRLRSTGGDVTPSQLVASAQHVKAPLATAHAGVVEAQRQIGTVDPASLLAPVRTGVDELSARLKELDADLVSLIVADNAVLKASSAAHH